MLKRVEIKNYRSCSDVVVDNLGHLTALVGRNGVGKSNILKAIDWVARTASSVNPIETGDAVQRIVTIEVELGGKLYEYSIDVKFPMMFKEGLKGHVQVRESLRVQVSRAKWVALVKRNNETVEMQKRPSRIEIGLLTPSLPAIQSLVPSTSPLAEQIKPFLRFLSAVRYYALDEPSDSAEIEFVRQREYEKWLAQYSATGTAGPSVVMRLLHMALSKRDEFNEIESLLGSNGVNLISNIYLSVTAAVGEPDDVDGKDTMYELRFRPAESIFNYRYRDLSVGTRRVLCILTSMLFDASSVMLIEHPEDSIHSGLLRKVISLLHTYSDPAQIILASHSPVVFDCLSPSEIRLVTMERAGTKIRSLGDESKAAQRFLEDEGTLSEFLEVLEKE